MLRSRPFVVAQSAARHAFGTPHTRSYPTTALLSLQTARFSSSSLRQSLWQGISRTLTSLRRRPAWSSSWLTVSKQTRGMKVRSSVKKLCDGCKSVRRKGYVYIICSKNPKHKQRQG